MGWLVTYGEAYINLQSLHWLHAIIADAPLIALAWEPPPPRVGVLLGAATQ